MIKNILFVCQGDTCRSPMAKAVLDDAISKDEDLKDAGIQVKTAGLQATLFAPASEEAILTMEAKKLSVAGHVSTPLGKRLIDWSEMIITMDQNMKAEILQSYPQAKVLAIDCPNPAGRGLEEYKKCAEFFESMTIACMDAIKAGNVN